MKKIISVLAVLALACTMLFAFTSCGGGEIIVQTNAYFAPFEYYDGSDIVGVDVEIMELVGKKLNKTVKWQDGDFGIIIDTVKEGKILVICGKNERLRAEMEQMLADRKKGVIRCLV